MELFKFRSEGDSTLDAVFSITRPFGPRLRGVGFTLVLAKWVETKLDGPTLGVVKVHGYYGRSVYWLCLMWTRKGRIYEIGPYGRLPEWLRGADWGRGDGPK